MIIGLNTEKETFKVSVTMNSALNVWNMHCLPPMNSYLTPNASFWNHLFETEEQAILSYEKVKKHDEIKTNYCKDKNIPLIRIPYWEKDNMEYFLFDEMVKYKAIEKVG